MNGGCQEIWQRSSETILGKIFLFFLIFCHPKSDNGTGVTGGRHKGIVSPLVGLTDKLTDETPAKSVYSNLPHQAPENQLLPDLYTNIKSFRQKIILFQSQLRKKCFTQFKTCEIFSHTTETEFPVDFAVETLSTLNNNFDSRFSDFHAIANEIKLFQNPFDSDIETLAPEIQMEIIDLQCSDMFKNKYQNSSLLEFYKSLPLAQFDNLHKFARGLFSVFGTTYLCEKTFSKMKYTKNVYRSKLTDQHLKSLLIIATSKINPQLQTMVGENHNYINLISIFFFYYWDKFQLIIF